MRRRTVSLLSTVAFVALPYAGAAQTSFTRASSRPQATAQLAQNSSTEAKVFGGPKTRVLRKHLYWTVTPRVAGAATIYIGPYDDLAGCRDMLGSAIFAHPWACHTDPSGFNCRNIGNGFAYPKSYPYPLTPDLYLTGPDCVRSADPSLRLKKSWYFLYYTIDGGGVEACKEYKTYKEVAKITPGMELGFYRDSKCPGAPCFSVGSDTACN